MATASRHPAPKQHDGGGNQAAISFGIPELKNPRYFAIFKAGRQARFRADRDGLGDAVPLYSHNATYQALFTKGWGSVTEVHLLQARYRRHQEGAHHATATS